jgi:hypothetical protein
MQRAITVTAIVVLLLVGVAIKVMVSPSKTVAGTHDSNGSIGSIQSAVSIYDLHVSHPGMKALPVQAAPLP